MRAASSRGRGGRPAGSAKRPYISLYMQSNVPIMRKNVTGYQQYPAGFYLSIPQMEVK